MSKEKLITQFKGKTFSSNEQVIRWLEKAIDQTREETIDSLNVGFLRQWLNEDRITDKPLVSDEDIMHFIKLFNKLKK